MGMKIEKINKKEYKLLENISVCLKKYTLTIEKGFEFDGASIPKLLWSFVGSPFTGAYTKSALIHDGLYRSNSLNRKDADKIFLSLMKEDGVHFFKRKIMYLGVRLCGQFSWNNRTKEELNKSKKFIKIERNK